MNDSRCVEFLQWALPRIGMRWQGFRTVRRQVCKRVRRRVAELELADLAAYSIYLERQPDEWAVLESLTRVTISRFNRDRGVFAFLGHEVLPVLAAGVVAQGADAMQMWSAGCASGEEPYTLSIIWQLELACRFPTLAIRILATDVDDSVLARARRGCFTASSLTELPERSRAAAFADEDRLYCIREPFKRPVTVARHDVRSGPPDGGPYDLVLCRNLAFTYFGTHQQRATATCLAGALRTGGALVLGAHEALPAGLDEFEPWSSTHRIYRKCHQDIT
jgi:chemotaxis protein methyltransferase CheR